MKDKIKALFATEKGKEIYGLFTRAVKDFGMSDMIGRGVLLGLSGGADSVMLLLLLLKYRLETGNFPLLAVHINHMIRGGEADRDEVFSRELCDSLDVELQTFKINVPKLASEGKIGLEECARNCRYSKFRDIILGREDIASIAVAHNADDNLETVIMNLVRGAGTRGMSGIPPIRENIIRPLIYVSKSDIVEALRSADIGFVLDSTNCSNEYKRNYIRNEVIPTLSKICDSPQAMSSRMTANLRADDEFITEVAEKIVNERPEIPVSELRSLHEAVLSRAISIFCGTSLSRNNVLEICELLSGDNFSYSLPGGKCFVCSYGICRITDDEKVSDYGRALEFGVNRFDEFDADIIVSERRIENSFLNVYKISIQANLSSAIISGDFCVRAKSDGDSVFYGGHTRKLKKLFNDRKIPPYIRPLIPMICDERGIVFAPGFGVRDDGAQGDGPYVAICIGRDKLLSKKRFYIASEFK